MPRPRWWPAGPNGINRSRTKPKEKVAARLRSKLTSPTMRPSFALSTPLEKGLANELSRLKEIFSTRDAYEGLSTLGRARPKFVGA